MRRMLWSIAGGLGFALVAVGFFAGDAPARPAAGTGSFPLIEEAGPSLHSGISGISALSSHIFTDRDLCRHLVGPRFAPLGGTPGESLVVRFGRRIGLRTDRAELVLMK